MNSHPPIIILDFDGVILPSIGARLALLKLLKDPRYNWNKSAVEKITTLDFIRRVESINSNKNIQVAYTIFSYFKEILPNFLDRIRFLVNLQRNFRKMEYSQAQFFPYVIPTLSELTKIALIGICTNSEEKRINRWLSYYSISSMISAFSSRKDRKRYGVKPDPRILLLVLWRIKKKANIRGGIDKNRVYFVGDNITDVLAAKNAGVKSIAVLSGHATRKELEEINPDFIIPTLQDIFSVPDLSNTI